MLTVLVCSQELLYVLSFTHIAYLNILFTIHVIFCKQDRKWVPRASLYDLLRLVDFRDAYIII